MVAAAQELPSASATVTPHGPRQWYIQLDTTKPFKDALQVTNGGAEHSTFELTWNGGLFYRQSQLVAEIARLPDEYVGEPLHQKAFRYVRDRRSWWENFAAGSWYTHPLVNLNGWGANVCGVDSRMFALLLDSMGYQARTTWYPHHGVASVMIDGHWEMYDVTYGAYFFQRNGEIADEQALAADSSLIVTPDPKVIGFDFSRGRFTDHPYLPLYAEVLKEQQSVGQAPVFNSPNPVPSLDGRLAFTLPPDARLTLPIAVSQQPAVNPEGYPILGSAPIFAGARLTLPAGRTGKVDAPLILTSVQGDGKFLMSGEVYDAETLNQRLSGFDAFNHEVQVLASESELEFTYSLNPKMLAYSQSNEIIIKGQDGEFVSKLVSSAVELEAKDQVPTGELLVVTLPNEDFSVDGTNWYSSGTAITLPTKGSRWDAFIVQFRSTDGGEASIDQSIQIEPSKQTKVFSADYVAATKK